MRFNRMEIHGFKSFAEPVVIEFDKGITCVVGPNGSGKSNICDALRWVLGSQSPRELRGDRMEDIIFAGTANRKSRGMAEVSLYIDNEDSELPIDYNEVVITRRLYRSGESEYFINNNRCRMRDIRNLIMDTGIGVEGYSIIGQGRISDIISNDTESIREILEETAGIVMYRSKKAEAERKLVSATDNMDRVNDIIGEIEGRIGGLREDSEKAQEFLVLRDRHKELEINITLRNIENLERKNEEINTDISGLAETLRQNEDLRNAVVKNLSENNGKREALDLLIEENRAAELEIVENINRLTNQREINRERLSAISRNAERLEREIEELAEKIGREEESSRELFSNREEAHKKMEELQTSLDEIVGAYTEKSDSIQKMGLAVDEKKNRLFELQNEINNKSAEITSIENLRETLMRRKETVQKEKSAGGSLEESRRQLQDAEEAREKAVIRLDELKESKNDLRSRYTDMLADERSLARDIEDVKIAIGQLAARKKTFEEMETSYEGFDNAVRFIMRSGVSGLRGVVADIIEVPQGLETAVEIALGGAIQNIVCEDDESARLAIRNLKENKAGRLTFIPLSSIRPKPPVKDSTVSSAPGFEGYAVERVKCDEAYASVLEYLLGNVVIMKNMADAVRASKSTDANLKFVTLEGEIVSRAGTITGGRGKHRSANILERKAEISALGSRLSDRQNEQKEKEDALAELRFGISRTDESVNAKDEEIRKAEMDVFAKENEISVIRTSLADMESVRERWQKELENIEKEETNSRHILEQRRNEITAGEAEKERLENEIEKENARYEAEREKLSDESEKITQARIALSAQESEKNKIDAIADRVQDSLNEYAEEKKQKEDELAAQAAEKEDLLSGGGETDKKVEESEEKKRETAEHLEKLRNEKTELLLRIDEDTKARDTLDETIMSIQTQKGELEIRQARQDTQLENAKNKLWEEFDVSYLQALEMKQDDFVMTQAVRENRNVKNRMKELGEVNIGAIEEYAKVSERYEFLTEQRQDIETSMAELNGIIKDMDKIIRSRFKSSFDSVVDNFESVFRELYGGGHANISLADENDPFDSEIEITAQPPGKQLKHINLLSGGEKTMTAIALMFAVLKTKPTPCCVLDEVEAALDDSNLNIFGNYLQNFENVQFTLITHQKATMEHADIMYGITMPESGVSKVYSLKLGDEPDMEEKNVG
jgi:chromosome segregation protein